VTIIRNISKSIVIISAGEGVEGEIFIWIIFYKYFVWGTNWFFAMFLDHVRNGPVILGNEDSSLSTCIYNYN
jgi:hypothetical protein